ncbi:hypothetical protein PAAG_01763 [Paracoccidioides lutzii Pb01]|uniref:Phosphatidylethanolamine-binding protein n=1 Tax=Paracoccidioides lutzii (strain ATCC MYA-826 / Pb01) TaxID=502779 RepID=C1GTB8_PARBA|nr:hypothetical protein PAAG_01763 [Paracoccidioides lutzii Pb01]EEH39301.2 hypothetical protein PAAG_01763 [Paracoccidioides lutzii Pb01]
MVRFIFSLIVTSSIALAKLTFSSHPQQPIQDDGIQVISPIRDALVKSYVIPEVLDDFYPTFTLYIAYPPTHTTTRLGNNVTTNHTWTTPVLEFHHLSRPPMSPMPALQTENVYTVALTDPDSRNHDGSRSEMCHWIVSNLSNMELSPEYHPFELEHNVDDYSPTPIRTFTPEVLVPYLAPWTHNGTDPHRLVFVLLEGNSSTANNVTVPRDRKDWGYGERGYGVRDWATENGLHVVGANFFWVENGGW